MSGARPGRVAVALALPLATGGISGAATSGATRTWYPSLRKPPLNPPPWVFAPVWTVLYVLIGLALFLVVTGSSSGPGRRRAIAWWAAQLALNFAYPFVLFGRRALGPAFVEVVVLWLAIAATIREVGGVRRDAAGLLLPYLGWTSFAVYLTGSTWFLNRNR